MVNLGMGDSHTAASNTYAKQLGWDVVAVNGTTSADWLPGGPRMPDVLPGGDAAAITLGTNDAFQGVPISVYAANMEAIAAHVGQFYTRVILIKPPKIHPRHGLFDREQRLGRALPCDNYVCVDAWSMFSAAEFPDGIHMTVAHHAELAAAVQQAAAPEPLVLPLLAVVLAAALVRRACSVHVIQRARSALGNWL